MKTWQIELVAVALCLSIVTLATGARPVEWIGSLAVILSFCHAQVADRLAEKESERTTPDVECHRMAARYFVSKEILWLIYFIAHRSYAALVGVGLFLAYPVWRRWWRAERSRLR